MLTTEKLFRGDTEFALMERVRKAEVDPPSKFNRRVSPELDRIVLKALARDVNDRYQNSAELHADLRAVLEGYRFDVRELRDFMRKEFRREYTKERQDSDMALSSVPEDERVDEYEMEVDEPEIEVSRPEPPAHVLAPLPEPIDNAPAVPEVSISPQPQAPPPEAPPNPEPGQSEKSGFFSRMFRKRR
jgi:hypothetical protein